MQVHAGLVIMLYIIRYMHAAPANAGGLIGYSLYNGHLKYPKTIKWRPRTTINALSQLVQSFYYTDIQGNLLIRTLEKKDTCIIHTLSCGLKLCFSI